MSFKIKSGADTKACTGEIVTYRINPLLNILMSLVNSITQCVEGKYFTDEQRFGSDKFWHHWHHFEEVQDGVLMKDILHYALPFGFLGEIIGNILIHKILGIFSFREQKLKEIFKPGLRNQFVA